MTSVGTTVGEATDFRGKRALFLANEDSHFWNHSRFIAEFMSARGTEIHVLARATSFEKRIEQAGFHFRDWHLDRKNMNPLREFSSFLEAFHAFRSIRPHYTHHLALKAILHGSIMARLFSTRSISHFSGLGQLFVDESARSARARALLFAILRFAFRAKDSIATFETATDRELFIQSKIVPAARAILTKGVGVDTKSFVVAEPENRVPVVLLAGRYLRAKGVEEYAKAATILKERGVQARFVLAGQLDPGNPASISRASLEEWVAKGAVEDLGFQNDMKKVLASSDVVCFPSYYREGIPRILLEAGACGRPVVAADIPGSRSIVEDGVSGFIVPPRDVEALAQSLDLLIADQHLRQTLGINARERIAASYDVRTVTAEITALYQELTTD